MTYNPTAIARKVRIVSNDQVFTEFVSKSMTKAEPENKYNPTINKISGSCHCNCGDFTNRKAKLNPTFWSNPLDLCKHLRPAVANLNRKKALPEKCCNSCKTTEGHFYPLADSSGEAIVGCFICEACAKPKLQPEPPKKIRTPLDEWNEKMAAARAADATDDDKRARLLRHATTLTKRRGAHCCVPTKSKEFIMSKVFKVEHYDYSVTEHETLKAALSEATKRLEPWREGKDFVFPYRADDVRFADIEECGSYVFVCNNCCEATDCESYITVVEK